MELTRSNDWRCVRFDHLDELDAAAELAFREMPLTACTLTLLPCVRRGDPMIQSGYVAAITEQGKAFEQ